MTELEARLARLEDTQLGKVRIPALDVIGTMHIMECRKLGVPWDCICNACQYVRAEPRLVTAIYKALNKP